MNLDGWLKSFSGELGEDGKSEESEELETDDTVAGDIEGVQFRIVSPISVALELKLPVMNLM